MAASVQVCVDNEAVEQRKTWVAYAPHVFVLLALFAVVIGLQWLGHAYRSELGGYPDESAHFITGLMIRDYVAAGAPTTPIRYAEDYYFHYPKVAFGMWGPLLHILEGAWMLIAPSSPNSVLLLMALITTLTAVLLYWTLAREFSIEQP